MLALFAVPIAAGQEKLDYGRILRRGCFSVDLSEGYFVVQYPDTIWTDRKQMEAVWSSADERLKDGLRADAILVIDIPDQVVWQNDLLQGARRADSVARLPPDVLNKYKPRLQAHAHKGDSPDDLMKEAEELERDGKPEEAAAVRATIDVLTRRGELP